MKNKITYVHKLIFTKKWKVLGKIAFHIFSHLYASAKNWGCLFVVFHNFFHGYSQLFYSQLVVALFTVSFDFVP